MWVTRKSLEAHKSVHEVEFTTHTILSDRSDSSGENFKHRTEWNMDPMIKNVHYRYPPVRYVANKHCTVDCAIASPLQKERTRNAILYCMMLWTIVRLCEHYLQYVLVNHCFIRSTAGFWQATSVEYYSTLTVADRVEGECSRRRTAGFRVAQSEKSSRLLSFPHTLSVFFLS